MKKAVKKTANTVKRSDPYLLRKNVTIKTRFNEKTSAVVVLKDNFVWGWYLPPGYKLLPVYLDHRGRLEVRYNDANFHLVEQAYDSLVLREVDIRSTDIDLDKTIIMVIRKSGLTGCTVCPDELDLHVTGIHLAGEPYTNDAIMFVVNMAAAALYEAQTH